MGRPPIIGGRCISCGDTCGFGCEIVSHVNVVELLPLAFCSLVGASFGFSDFPLVFELACSSVLGSDGLPFCGFGEGAAPRSCIGGRGAGRAMSGIGGRVASDDMGGRLMADMGGIGGRLMSGIGGRLMSDIGGRLMSGIGGRLMSGIGGRLMSGIGGRLLSCIP